MGGSIPKHCVQLRSGRIQSLGREGRVIKAVKQTEGNGGRGRSLGLSPFCWKDVICRHVFLFNVIILSLVNHVYLFL